MVSFDMSMPMPEVYIAFMIGNGSEDETSPFENDDDDDMEEDAPIKDEADILYTRGSRLNESKQLELEGLTPFNDEHRGIPFVHCLTKTNIETGIMVCVYSCSFFLIIIKILKYVCFSFFCL